MGIDSAPQSAPSVQEAEGLTDQVTGIQEQPLDSLSPALTIEGSEAISASSGEVTTGATGPRLAAGTERHPRIDSTEYTNVTPAQVIEAALFVGGAPLSAKKICSLLRGSFDAAFVEQAIDGLNDQYVSEGRPYEIRLGDGGYRMELRPEYEKLRQRVYGSGPREVKLSQEILEVLSLVAYRQPITQEEIESHGKQNAGNLLRQLLRRDLVAIQRGDGGRKDVRYLTTPRFLNVFGIGSLDELPQPEDLMRK
jgi:segregation and condensation protein B